MSESLKTLRKKRKVLRASLTKLCNNIEDQLMKDQPDTGILAGLADLLEQRFNTLTGNDADISAVLFQDEKVDEQTLEEQLGVDEYE